MPLNGSTLVGRRFWGQCNGIKAVLVYVMEMAGAPLSRARYPRHNPAKDDTLQFGRGKALLKQMFHQLRKKQESASAFLANVSTWAEYSSFPTLKHRISPFQLLPFKQRSGKKGITT